MSEVTTKQFTDNLFRLRQRCRTDLHYLATEVLQYTDIDRKVHGPIIDALPKFKGGKDLLHGDRIIYRPFGSIWDLEGHRKMLIMYPRGSFKTTLATISHCVQWLINYPNVRILITTGIGEQQRKLANALLSHFRYNPTLRFLFPDFCPPAQKATDWGSLDGFSVPCRNMVGIREPSVSFASTSKVIAGGHYEVILHSDLVDKENINTSDQIEHVKDFYKYCNPLLERGGTPPRAGWSFMEGTPYDFSDLHNTIIEEEEKREPEKKQWHVVVRGAHNKDGSLLFPARLDEAELARTKEEMGPWIYAAQYECQCLPDKGGLATREQIKFIPRSLLRQMMPGLRKYVTVDLHGMEQKDSSDFTVITLSGFDRDGRVYVLDIKRGHYTPFEVIDVIFRIYTLYPDILSFKVEKDAHARVLLPFLQRERIKRGKFPNIIAIPRSNKMSKKQRIKGLQPWFEAGVIRFADDLDCQIDLIHEITRFPKYAHDDILDTLADQMQNRDGLVTADVQPRPQAKVLPPHQDKFLGFDSNGGEMWARGNNTSTNYDDITGL